MRLPRVRLSLSRLMVEVAILAVLFALFLPSLARSSRRRFWDNLVFSYNERAGFCRNRVYPDDEVGQKFLMLARRYERRSWACRWGGATDPDLEMAIYTAIMIDELALLERVEKVDPERVRPEWERRLARSHR